MVNDRRRVVGLAVAAIAVSTIVVAFVEQTLHVEDASAIYLVAVVVAGSTGGTIAALVTSIVAFIVYDVLFTDPRLSLTVADPNELLNLALVLIVAVAVGRLAAIGRERTIEADDRAAESDELFVISRTLATASDTRDAVGVVVARIAAATDLARVWVGLEGGPHERILADSGSGPIPSSPILQTLSRPSGVGPAAWVRTHQPGVQGAGPMRASPPVDIIRVMVETSGTHFGWLWGSTKAGSSAPDPGSTRLLSVAADQIALGLRRDRLREEATQVEVARRSDALKSALLDAVSHDLRTPLASIRAAAGNLADHDIELTTDEVHEAAETIDLEAMRLDRFVRSILDLSRIEAGALHLELEVFDLGELIERAVEQRRPLFGQRSLTVDVPDTPLLVEVDGILLDTIVANILDNVIDHTPIDAPVAVHASRLDATYHRLTIEDGGPGIAQADRERMFEKFQRRARQGDGPRRGPGLGLSIVRGMTEALRGRVTSRTSVLGGLAIDLDLAASAADDAIEPEGES